MVSRKIDSPLTLLAFIYTGAVGAELVRDFNPPRAIELLVIMRCKMQHIMRIIILLLVAK